MKAHLSLSLCLCFGLDVVCVFPLAALADRSHLSLLFSLVTCPLFLILPSSPLYLSLSRLSCCWRRLIIILGTLRKCGLPIHISLSFFFIRKWTIELFQNVTDKSLFSFTDYISSFTAANECPNDHKQEEDEEMQQANYVQLDTRRGLCIALLWIRA